MTFSRVKSPKAECIDRWSDEAAVVGGEGLDVVNSSIGFDDAAKDHSPSRSGLTPCMRWSRPFAVYGNRRCGVWAVVRGFWRPFEWYIDPFSCVGLLPVGVAAGATGQYGGGNREATAGQDVAFAADAELSMRLCATAGWWFLHFFSFTSVSSGFRCCLAA